VLCKDTPAFMANRIGVFGIMDLFHLVEDMGLTVEEVDRLTGPVMGPEERDVPHGGCGGPGHARDTSRKAFRTTARTTSSNSHVRACPEYLKKMVEKNMLGSKTGKGFFFKDRSTPKGDILSLDLKTLEYRPQVKPKFATLDAAKKGGQPA
jgi:3-hydroxyacyl-CoA dehydrogenase